MMATTIHEPTITELCMELERMRLAEEVHIKTCRVRALGLPCLVCDERELAWIDADKAITVFLAGVE